MTTTIITENHPRWPLYSQLRKCGEITASADGRYFGLNCIHCATIFPWINVKEFLGHLHEQHASTLQTVKLKDKKKTQPQEQKQLQEEHTNLNSKRRKLSASSASSPSEKESAATTAEVCSHDDDDSAILKTVENDNDSCDVTSSAEDQLDVDEMQEVYELIFETMAESDLKLSSKSEADIKTAETHSKSSSCDDEEENDEDFLANDKLDLFSTINREVLIYIIEVHAENSILWDKAHKFSQCFRKKLKIYKEMTKEIEERFNLKLKYTSIREAFVGLRKLYTDELLDRVEEEKNIQLDKTPPPWCFEKLEFLRQKELADNSTLVVPIDQLMLLADIYKRHPVLWNLDCDDSHHKARQIETQHKMLYEVNAKLDMTMTLKQLRARITRLRKFYIANKRKRLESAKHSREFEFAPEHPHFYAQLQFLEPYVGPFRCEQCGEEKLASFHAFRKHLAAHEGRLQYSCRYCQKDFKLYTNMETHERRHTGEKPYVCTVCHMSFATSTDLKLHGTRHTGEKNYVCHVCGRAFGTSSHLRNHKLRHHANLVRPERKGVSLLKKSFEIIDNEVYICFENSN